ncbi:hypothetical protein [Kineococcus sp. SYSU DK006]|uniref:hypothetical protein n=1 Tax=Kineococcus sp. SYSU DK006 TaxID=3383127 RepID=UPI003D7EA449
MRPLTRRGWTLLALLTVSTLSACSSDQPAPTDAAKAWDVAFNAAEADGAGPLIASGAEGWQSSDVTVGPLTAGTTYGAFAACTGGGSLGLDLAGTAVTVDCDGQGHRVGDLVPTTGTATFSVTEAHDGPSQWGVAVTTS